MKFSQSELNRNEAEYKSLNNQINELKIKLDQSKKFLKEINQVKEGVVEKKILSSNIVNLEDNLQQFETRKKELTKNKTNLEEKVKTKASRLQEFEEKINQKEEVQSKIEKEFKNKDEALKGDIEINKNLVENTQKRILEAKNHIQDLTKTNSSLNEEFNEMKEASKNFVNTKVQIFSHYLERLNQG